MIGSWDYDRWKLATPPHYEREPFCAACEDAGCEECCPTSPVTLQDMEEIQAEMDAAGALP